MGEIYVNIKENFENYRQYKREIKQLTNYRIFQDIGDKKIRGQLAVMRKNILSSCIFVIMIVMGILNRLNLSGVTYSIATFIIFFVLVLFALAETALIYIYKCIWIIYLIVPLLSFIVWILLRVIEKIMIPSAILANFDHFIPLISALLAFILLLVKLPIYMLRELKRTQILVISPIVAVVSSIMVSQYLNVVTLLLLLVKLIMDNWLDRKEKIARKKLYRILMEDETLILYKDLKECVYSGGVNCLNIIMSCDKTRSIVENNEKI